MSPAAAPSGHRTSAADSATFVTRLVGEEAEAEQGVAQVVLPMENVGPPLVAHPKATIPEQPYWLRSTIQRRGPNRPLDSITRRVMRRVAAHPGRTPCKASPAVVGDEGCVLQGSSGATPGEY